jgi:hypothetical protein
VKGSRTRQAQGGVDESAVAAAGVSAQLSLLMVVVSVEAAVALRAKLKATLETNQVQVLGAH